MGFFDKLKEGASKAADKAKDSVEVVRINSQIAAKRKEIEKCYMQIGEVVFRAYVANELTSIDQSIVSTSDMILSLQRDIVELEEKIKIIREEKDCVCGKLVPLESRFCPSCGHKFEENGEAPVAIAQYNLEVAATTSVNPSVEIVKETPAVRNCSNCQAELGSEDMFCEQCGTATGQN